MRLLLTVFCLVFISGCVSLPVPTAEQRNDPSLYGPRPNDNDAHSLMMAHLETLMKDPGSMQIRNKRGPRQMYMSRRTLRKAELKFGWGYCVEVNAKNGFGAYTGFADRFILINYGKIIDVGFPYSVEMCQKVTAFG